MDFQDFIERYGLSLGVLAALALVIAILPGNAENDESVGVVGFDEATGEAQFGSIGDSGASDLGGGTSTGAGAGGGSLGGSGAAGAGTGGPTDGAGTAGGEATGGGGSASEVQFGQGPNCRADGRQHGISVYQPPCALWTGTDNGGVTTRGVTKSKILVVRYLAQLDPGTRAILEGARLADDAKVVERAYQSIVSYHNAHDELYGRQVVFQNLQASGESEDEASMKADAQKIADEIKAFAVTDGDPAAGIPTILATELAERGVLCLCTTSSSSTYYRERPGKIFSSLPTIDEYAAHAAEFVGKRMKGKKAIHAGDEVGAPTQNFRNQTRKFGLLFIAGARGRTEPEAIRGKDAMVAEFARWGIKFEKQVSYLYDPGRNQNEVTTLITQFKNAGVTTIVPIWDPLYPILITKEATRQFYGPEWLIVGTGLSDTTAAARLYDQAQWRHAFGISPLWVTWATVPRSPGYREFHHGKSGHSAGDEGVLINIYRARWQTLFRGIHMAGPNLTNETFAQAQYNYPRTGGTASAPLVYLTPNLPTEIKDFVEVFYDITRRGPDERGEPGTGMIMKAKAGKRYELGEWPKQAPFVNDSSAVDVADDPKGGDPPHEEDGHKHQFVNPCSNC